MEALPKAESRLFNYIMMRPIFREPNVQDLVEKTVELERFKSCIDNDKSFDSMSAHSMDPQTIVRSRTVSEDNLMTLAKSLIK